MMIYPHVRFNMMKETGTVGKNHFLSYWDIFPLEGPLLSKLQTLRVVSGVQTSLELDRFLTRLGGSCAAKTLQSLTILCSANMPWTVNWTVLRDCVCNLEALEVLKLKYFTIFFDCTDDDNHDENKEKRPVRIAPRVRSLDISCGLDLETKLVVMALFPNIKSLTLAELEDFCEPALDGRLFPNTGSSIDWSGSKAGVDLTLFDPFPRLEFLNIFFSTISGLQDSRLMQYWLQRPTRLRVFGLALFDPSMNSNDGLLSFLCQHAVLTQSLYLKGDGLPWVRTVLTSSVVAEMENLQLTDTRQDLVKLVQSILKPEIPCSEWTLTLEPHIQRQVAAMLPWSRTLKRLSMRIVLDSTQTKGQGTSSLDSMRALLLMLPRLEDLELREAFMDLALLMDSVAKMLLHGRMIVITMMWTIIAKDARPLWWVLWKSDDSRWRIIVSLSDPCFEPAHPQTILSISEYKQQRYFGTLAHSSFAQVPFLD